MVKFPPSVVIFAPIVTPLWAPRTSVRSPSTDPMAWEIVIEPAAIIVSVDAVPATVASLLIAADMVMLPGCPALLTPV